MDALKAKPTTTDPGAQLWLQDPDPVLGLRVWGTNDEHPFPQRFLTRQIDRVWLGRDPAGPDASPDEVLGFDHPSLSRRHAAIEWRGGDLVVIDQHSKNGTIWSGGAVHGILRLVSGMRVSFGAIETVAYSVRKQGIRAGYQRFLGYGDAHQLGVDRLQHGAIQRDHLALIGPAGSGARALARYVHDSSPGSTWPFETPKKLPTKADLAGQRELVASAAYGTLVLDATGRKRLRAENLPRLFEFIAQNAFHVRLVVLLEQDAKPGLTLEHLVGPQVRDRIAVIPIPALAERVGELQKLLPDTIQHHSRRARAVGSIVTPDDHATLAACITGPRRGQARIETFDDLEEVVERLVVLRKEGSTHKAEAVLGWSYGAMSRWAAKYGFRVAKPG